jgi:large subunit ribosomal protein L17
MRHRRKRNHLGKAADQRNALVRTLATSFIKNDEIVTTLTRAKVLKSYVEHLITLGKRGDLHAMRHAARLVYNHPTGRLVSTDKGKTISETVLRKLFTGIAPQCADRNGGYTRLVQVPPRRGDNAPMALLQLVDGSPE